jgi:hypothetical protein
MTESQFIIWLKGFLSNKNKLDYQDYLILVRTLQSLKSATNESYPSSGKQILHD